MTTQDELERYAKDVAKCDYCNKVLHGDCVQVHVGEYSRGVLVQPSNLSLLYHQSCAPRALETL